MTGDPGSTKLLPASAYGRGGNLAIGALAGALVFAAAFVLLAARRGSWVRNRLAAHTGGVRRTRRRRRDQRSALLTGLLRATEHAFGGLRQWQAVQKMLDRGDMPLRAAEFLYLAGGIALAARPARRRRGPARARCPPSGGTSAPRCRSSSPGGGCAAGSASSRTSCPTC